jgi:hypothetical protein
MCVELVFILNDKKKVLIDNVYFWFKQIILVESLVSYDQELVFILSVQGIISNNFYSFILKKSILRKIE